MAGAAGCLQGGPAASLGRGDVILHNAPTLPGRSTAPPHLPACACHACRMPLACAHLLATPGLPPRQVVFPAETVQASRERQAALLMSEQLLERTHAAEARAAELQQVRVGRLVAALPHAGRRPPAGRAGQHSRDVWSAFLCSLQLPQPPPHPHTQLPENDGRIAVRAEMDSMAAQADLAVAKQGAGGMERDLMAARLEAAAAGEREGATRVDLLQLQVARHVSQRFCRGPKWVSDRAYWQAWFALSSHALHEHRVL